MEAKRALLRGYTGHSDTSRPTLQELQYANDDVLIGGVLIMGAEMPMRDSEKSLPFSRI